VIKLAQKKTGYGIRITIIKIRDKEEQKKIHDAIKKSLAGSAHKRGVLTPYAKESVLYFIEDFSYDYNGLIDRHS